jgi:peptide/nickel transport system substrate-binding protein
MMKNAKKLLALLLACIFIAALASCANGGTTGASSAPSTAPSAAPSSAPSTAPSAASTAPTSAAPAVDPDRTLNVAVSQDSGSLDPLTQTLGGFMDVMRTYMDVLFDFKPDGTIDWLLSTGYDTVSDTHHTLHLREGVTFSNGNPFTAEDVLFSMTIARDHPQWFMNVETVDFDKTNVTDDFTIDLWFTKYDIGQFPALMLMYIFDAESYDVDAMATDPVGTGPYIVTDYVANSHLIVEARDGYWGSAPAIKKIQFNVMNEEAQRVNAVTIGDVDSANIPLKDVEYIESLGNYTVMKVSAAAASVAYFNVTEGSLLGTLEAREAVMYAINRQSIVDMAYSGQSSTPRWPVSEACPDFEERFAGLSDVYKIGYDPVKAAELAKQEGLAGQTLRIMTNGSQQFITIAEIIQNNLEEIGVHSEIINYDQATYWGMMMDQNNYEIALYLIASPKRFGLDMLVAYPQFFNLGWNDADRNAYLEIGLKGLGTPDPEARGEILYEIAKEFNEVHLWYPLAENISPYAHSKDIAGIEYYADGGVRYYKWTWVS